MSALPKIIQGLILFSSVLGVFFLWEVQPPVLPVAFFYFVAFGWVLFVVDSILTFVRPRVSYYLGVVLAALALSATLSEPTHFAIVTGGNLPAAATIILGSSAEVLLIIFGGFFIISERRKGDDPWAWPGKEEAPASESR